MTHFKILVPCEDIYYYACSYYYHRFWSIVFYIKFSDNVIENYLYCPYHKITYVKTRSRTKNINNTRKTSAYIRQFNDHNINHAIYDNMETFYQGNVIWYHNKIVHNDVLYDANGPLTLNIISWASCSGCPHINDLNINHSITKNMATFSQVNILWEYAPYFCKRICYLIPKYQWFLILDVAHIKMYS